MKKKLIISIVVFLLVITGVVIGILCRKNSREFEIKQLTNGGVPYSWEYEINDNSIIEYVDTRTVNNNPDVDGGEIEKYFKFRTVKEGKTTIRFNYMDFRNNSVYESNTYEIVVDKKLNATVTKLED